MRVLFNATLNDQVRMLDGPFEDADGRRPWFVGDLATDGQGKLYTCGRWYVLPEEVERIGVNRHGLLVAVFFTVLDVSGDL